MRFFVQPVNISIDVKTPNIELRFINISILEAKETNPSRKT